MSGHFYNVADGAPVYSIVGANGRVEGVRMASRPARMSDMMMLSGAKNWVFRPATKDGKPVRYRLPITWSVSQ
mgnify:CR=1 FL=1